MRIEIPALSVVVLVGASGSGKSTFARTHFLPTEVVSSDACRGMVDDDENSLEATTDAFELVHFIAAKRLQRGKSVVIDATNVQPDARKPLLDLCREYHAVAVAIVVDTPERVCLERNESRPDRQFGPHVVRNHVRQLKRSLGSLRRERFRYTYVVKPEDIDNVEIVRVPLWTDRSQDTGPFDIIGDVHGCFLELKELLQELGYTVSRVGDGWSVDSPNGRKLIFLGDLVDRGPDSVNVLRLAMQMVKDGQAICVPGNHDVKLLKKLEGKNVEVKHGLETTLAQLEGEEAAFIEEVKSFLDSLISHFVLDGGSLVVAHAGMRQDMQGRASTRVRDFALYGETTGETDEFGLPVRYNWASEYQGRARVVYGHTPVPEAEWLNRTINIDTGCVFGGKLTALRYPELETVSVGAREAYAEPARPIEVPTLGLSAQHQVDDVLDVADVTGKRLIHTSLAGNITIWPEQSTAALEIMSRFGTDPKWLVYLPPTMSPPATSTRDGYLEYPSEAFTYYLDAGVSEVVCEEKHMGSRAVVFLCKDEDVARKRFGVEGQGIGAIATRTGRKFFEDPSIEQSLLQRIRDAMTMAGSWEHLETDWVILDCELMPWSVKAQDLLRRQYAQTGVAALAMTRCAIDGLHKASERGVEDLEETAKRWEQREKSSQLFVDAYRRYCWPVNDLEDYRIAPFHILATEGLVHMDKDHRWHMNTIATFCASDPILMATEHRTVKLDDETAVKDACAWWESLVASGGEGMVVKPLGFVARQARGIVQPAVKCRGPEYLRIIYGPSYDEPENLGRLRRRGLSKKQSLAVREFSLGMEALSRFVQREPLRRVHECVFAVLALESEPVDPRL